MNEPTPEDEAMSDRYNDDLIGQLHAALLRGPSDAAAFTNAALYAAAQHLAIYPDKLVAACLATMMVWMAQAREEMAAEPETRQ